MIEGEIRFLLAKLYKGGFLKRRGQVAGLQGAMQMKLLACWGFSGQLLGNLSWDLGSSAMERGWPGGSVSVLPQPEWVHINLPGFTVLCYAKLLLSCLTLCDPTDCSPPSMGILQARILQAAPSSRGSSWPRDRTRISKVSCICRQALYRWCHLGGPGFSVF